MRQHPNNKYLTCDLWKTSGFLFGCCILNVSVSSIVSRVTTKIRHEARRISNRWVEFYLRNIRPSTTSPTAQPHNNNMVHSYLRYIVYAT